MASVSGSRSSSQTVTLFSLRRNVSRPSSSGPSVLFLHPYEAPIDSIPAEVISYIFTFACAPNFSEASGSQAIRISHVSRRWRAVALSTSTLWATICMSLPLGSAQTERTLAFLQRSRVSALTLHLDFRDSEWSWDELGEHDHPFGYKEMMTTMDVLLPHIIRWKNIDLLTDTWTPIYTFLSYCKGVRRAPVLSRVSLSRCNAYYAENGQTFQPVNLRDPIILFGDAQMNTLQELALSGVHVDWSSSCLRGLKLLELAYLATDVVPSFEQFIKILENCPELEKLTIMGRGPNIDAVNSLIAPIPMHSWLEQQASIRLDHLESLTLGFTDITYAVELLSLFQLPKLRFLSFEDLEKTLFHNGECYTTALLDALSSPSSGIALAGIKSLEFKGVRASSASLTRFLRLCSSVTKLTTIGCSKVLIDALRPVETPAIHVLLPALSQVHMESCIDDSEDVQAIFEAVFDRFTAQHGVSALKEIYVSDEWDEEPPDEDMALLLASGVKLLCA